MAYSLIKTNMKYLNKELLLLSSCKGEGTRKKAKCLITNTYNTRNEAEEGRRRVKLAEYVRSGDKEDELEKHVTSYTSR